MSKIWLIAEGETDVLIFRRLLELKGYEVEFEARPVRGVGGLANFVKVESKKKGAQFTILEKMLDSILVVATPTDCMVILYDADEHTRQNDNARRRIIEICRHYCDTRSTKVIRLVARNAIEAWLLADDGLCTHFNQRPQNRDHEERPKRILEQWLGKLPYDSLTLRDKLLETMTGSGDAYSPSMKVAFQCLAVCDCHHAACQTSDNPR